MKKISPVILLAGTLCFSSSAAQIIRAPYVQLTTEHSGVVVWRCDATIDPVLRFGLHPDRLTGEVIRSEIRLRTTQSENPLHTAPEGTVQYEVPIGGLAGNTTYYYSLFDGDKLLAGGDESYHFTTHPKRGEDHPTRIWVVGDSGTGNDDQRAVFKAQQTFVQETGRAVDLYLHLGDMAYQSGKDGEFQPKFFDIYEPLLRNTVCWPTKGNHEGRTSIGFKGTGPYYDAYVCPTNAEAGGVPSGKEAYYSFDYGSIHFVCLNSFDIPRGTEDPMMAWLKKDLQAAREQSKWLVAFWHHPPYTKGSHDSDKEHELVDMRENFMPVLEDAGVDLVLTGHSHIYERSMLIDGAYHTPTHSHGVVLDDGDGNPEGDGAYRKSHGLEAHNGTVSIVAGHGGKLSSAKGVSPIMKTIIIDLGSVILDVDGDTLSAVMIDKDGRQRDPFQIVKRGTVSPKPVEKPWQPTAKDVEDLRRGASKKPVTKDKPVTQRMPAHVRDLIPGDAEWQYRLGSFGRAGNWATTDFDASDWTKGKGGLGYGYSEGIKTKLHMKNQHPQVQMRTTFTLPDDINRKQLGLGISYDDAFVCIINGQFAFAANVLFAKGKADVRHHESVTEEYFSLEQYARFFKSGENVIGIHGYNVKLSSSDFLMQPRLVHVLPGPDSARRDAKK